MIKICSKCKIPKDTNEFTKQRRNADGLDCWCEPHVISEDTLMTPQQIAEKVSKKKFIN